MTIMYTHRKYGMYLKQRILVNITTYVQSDTLLLADVFKNCRNMCLNIYELDPVYFVSAPGLAWQACLKKTGVKLELITDYDMILMTEKGIRGGICQASK